MRYALRLRIGYEFARPSGGGRQLLRIRPAHLPGLQTLESCAVKVLPAPLEQRDFTDFFGFSVTELVLPAGMREIDFTLEAQVSRLAIQPLADLSPPPTGLGAEMAQAQSLGPDAPHHFSGPSQRIPHVAAIADFARAATRGSPSTRSAILALGEALHAHMQFDPQATEVDTPIAEAFAGRRGVCQDLSQIMIAGLRALGIPAGYVSGYLRTLPPPGKPRLEGADAMHAWVRAWTGSRGGWLEYDPTNALLAGTDHVVVGYGRDYADAAPITGMLRLEGAQRGSHSVDLLELPEGSETPAARG